ncbi:hypothetical protein ACFOWE_22205 [Planomonospora corallina]|uniref:Secreted protein n=1 Tax=Planomonospora corallina TaxID=1806052 RepID=A0ABV8IAL8_9ACTN
MRQTLGFLAVWLGATVLAACVAWFGVRDVLRSEAVDDMSIQPISAVDDGPGTAALPAPPSEDPSAAPAASPQVGTPTASSVPAGRDRTTRRPATPAPVRSTARTDRTGSAPVATAPPDRRAASGSPRASAPARTSAPASTSAPTSAATSAAPRAPAQAAPAGDVRVVNVKGGSVSFTIENGVCRLISAAPRAGYETKVWENAGWMRVDLTKDGSTSSAFCIGHENRTDSWES